MTSPLASNPFWSRAASLLVALLALCANPATSFAQVALNGAPIHSGANHPNNASLLTVSQADCLQQTTFTFAVTGLTAQKTLSLWASAQGGDCTQSAQRNPGSTQTCYQVKAAYIPTLPPSDSVVVTAAALVNGIAGTGASGVANCIDSTAGDAPRKLVLYFLLDEASGNVTDSVTYDITFDLRGPPAPLNLAPSTFDDTTLLVKFCTPPGTTDVAGYYVYCDASGASGTVSSSANPVCSSTDTTTSTTVSSTAETTSASSSTSGAGGSTASASSGGGTTAVSSSESASSASSSSSSTGGTSTCTSSKFTAGLVPSGLVECKALSGITSISAEAPGFTVGVLGAVAIAGYDNVGNVGPLSTVVCGQTEAVTDFFEKYREVGGAGGNGCYCTFGRDEASPLGAFAFLTGVLAVAARRRQRGAK
jgi:hypothetical protein